MMGCLNAEQFDALLNGDVDAEWQAMESHVEGCARCRIKLVYLSEPENAEDWRVAMEDGQRRHDSTFLRELMEGPPLQAPVQPGPNGWIKMSAVRDRKPPPAPANLTVPGFEILAELGRGGMGVVYKARQRQPDRLVALKMILAGALATDEEMGRFRDEVEAISRLRHPNIVQIYECGMADGRLFFVLELVEGGTLADKICGQTQSPRAASQLIEALARAMHFVHDRGIIHRDLKPANVLLQTRKSARVFSDDEAYPADWDFRQYLPKITDFGLAKVVDRNGKLTNSGDIIGTPSYMAPEQAQGRPYAILPTIDVYALGAILYEMLTGQPPFHAETPLDTLYLVHSKEPVPPRKLRPEIPRDLEVICLKCLQKKPGRRYPTAEALADDLRRFNEGLTIQAKVIAPWQSMWSRAWERPATTVMSIMLVALLALVGWQQYQRYHETPPIDADQLDEQTSLRRSAELENARLRLVQARTACEQGQIVRGLLGMADLAGRFQELDGAVGANLATWSRHTPSLRVSLSPIGGARTATITPDGQAILVGLEQSVRRLSIAGDDRADTSWPVSGTVEIIKISPGGTRAAVVVGKSVLLLNPRTGQELSQPLTHAERVSALAFSPDGHSLLAGCVDGSLRVWDLPNGTSSPVNLKLDGEICSVAWDLSGKAFAAGSTSGQAKSSRVGDNAAQANIFNHPAAVGSLTFSPDAKTLYTGCNDGKLRIWDVEIKRLLVAPVGHPGGVSVVHLLPGGSTLMSLGADRLARLWPADLSSSGVAIPFSQPLAGLSLTHDGGRFATLDTTGNIQVWDAPAELPGMSRSWNGDVLAGFAATGDGRKVYLSSGMSIQVVEWDVVLQRSRSWATPPFGGSNRVIAVALDGSLVLVAGDGASNSGESAICETAEGKIVAGPFRNKSKVTAAAFRSDTSAVIIGALDGGVQIVDVKSGRITAEINAAGPVLALGVGPDGMVLIAAGGTGTRCEARAWSVSGKPMGPPHSHPDPIMQIAMEDDGVSVRTKDSRGVVRRFDSRTGADKPLPAAVAENSRVLAIDSEARASVVVGTDNIPRLLPATGDPILLHFDGAGGDCRAAVFVANGALVYTLSPDGIRCWDSVSGQPVGPVLQHAGAQYLALSSDGRRLFSWSAKNIRAWDVPTVVDQAPSERRRAVRIQTGAELAQGGSIRFLSALAWQELHKSTP